MDDLTKDLYQQTILEHNKKPRNFKKLEPATHFAEGYNPLCGDHLYVYLNVGEDGKIHEVTFTGEGCAISKASSSMMTQALIGKTPDEARQLFGEFQELVSGKLDPEKQDNHLGKLSVFSGIWHFPARVKCAILCWHTMKGALDKVQDSIKTE